MINIKKIILATIVSLGSLTMAFSQSHSEVPVISSDTVIYVTPEQLEEGVRAVAQSIVERRKASKVDNNQHDILSKDNVQLLKYQMLLSALGMNIGPVQSTTPANNVQQYRGNDDNSGVNSRLDRLENLLYTLLQNQNTRCGKDRIVIPSQKESPKTTIVSKGKKVDSTKTGNQEIEARLERVLDMIDNIKAENAQLRSQLNSSNSSVKTQTEFVYSTDTVTLRETIAADFKRQVFFVLGGDILTDDAVATLDNVVSVLNQYPNLVLDVIGYASVDGNKDFNLRLSAKRANKVLEYLTSRGVDPNRLFIQNGGVDADASIISTARRVDIVIHQ